MPAGRLRTLLLAYAACGAVLALTGLLKLAVGRPFAYFAREPAAALKDDDCGGVDCAVAGFLSNVGVLAWVGGAVITLAAAWLLTGRGARAATTLMLGGALTTLLALDDMFLFHDYVAGRYLGERPGQIAVYLVYGVLGVAYLRRLRAEQGTDTAPLLLAAGALLVASAGLDQAFPESYVAEDSLKLLGIATWVVALGFTAADLLRRDAPEALPPHARAQAPPHANA